MMTFKAKIDFKEFLKTQFYLTYSKGVFIWLSFLGVLMLVAAILGFSNFIPKNVGGNYWMWLVFGIMMTFLMPYSIYSSAKKIFASNKRMTEEITYSLSKDDITFTGESFTSTISWSKTFKIKEVKYFFLVYESHQVANFISKATLTEKDLADLRNILKATVVSNISLKR